MRTAMPVLRPTLASVVASSAAPVTVAARKATRPQEAATDATFGKRALLPALALATLLALSGCSSVSPPSASAPSPTPAEEVPARLTLEQAHDVTLHAIGLVGTPYRWGGNTPDSGFDCSGLIGYVYKSQAGITPPRTVAALVNWGQPVPAEALRTGDLVVFTQKGVSNHAGIYVGEGRFVHAPSSGGTVRLDSVAASYWRKLQVSYRRP